MSYSWGKKVSLVANGIILTKHNDLVFGIFFFSKLLLFTEYNFNSPSPEIQEEMIAEK